MSEYSLHFSRVAELAQSERILVRALAEEPELLPRPYITLYRYALTLARLGWIRGDNGRDLDLTGLVSSFRRWLRTQLSQILEEDRAVDRDALIRLGPLCAIRLDAMRSALLHHHGSSLSEERLEDEIGHKKFALVLGGGGGSGLAHLGVYGLLDELGITPDYIVGSSMGSLVGFLRALQRAYDPVGMMLAVPRRFDLRELFTPFSGRSRYGFPGAFHMNLLPMATKTIPTLLKRGLPVFADLPIELEIVSTGSGSGLDLDALDREMQLAGSSGFTPWKLRSKVRIFFKIVRKLANNPQFLRKVVFGSATTPQMRVIDAVGFSCAVPGILHYDIFDDHQRSHAILDELMEARSLLRLTDGGIVSNVPARVAWHSIQAGRLGHRNAMIYALDAFAPIANRNAMFIPVQRLARTNVVVNRPYADFLRTLKTVPSPINLAPSFKHLKRLVAKVHDDLRCDADYLRLSMAPIPAYPTWIDRVRLYPGLYGDRLQYRP